MTQEALGQLGGVLKRAVIYYEKGQRAPDALLLSSFAEVSADVLFILTGKRSLELPAQADLPMDEQLLLDAYRRCSTPARKHLIQSAALLAAGVEAGESKPKKTVRISAPGGNVAARDMHINNSNHEGIHGKGKAKGRGAAKARSKA